MKLRIAALCGALTFILSACPSPNGGSDGGTDAGGDAGFIGTGSCTGGCGPNQVCDEAKRVCVDGCGGGCTVGQICVKQGDNFACVSPATTCSGNACGEGQSTCVAGNCSCLPFTRASRDTCADQGRVCHDVYNPVTNEGGQCEDPQLFEYCRTDCPGGDCGQCPGGQGCDDRLFGDFGVCAHFCDNNTPCAPDEFCYAQQSGNSGFCYPKSLFGGQFSCNNIRPTSDGGTETYRTYASDVCLKFDDNGNPTETTPTGTCTWTFFKGDTRAFAFTYCRSAGPVPLNGACKTDPLPLSLTDTCSTGLECAPTGRGGDGICRKICNAQLRADGTPTQPGCAQDESCVNLYRFEDDNSVVGVCAKNCNVFSTAPNYGCGAMLGNTPAACVPTSPRGVQLVTGNGDGICVPQLPNAAAEGEPCVDTDPFNGAACQSGLICSQISGEAQPRCVKPCDVECAPGNDGGVPARCATEANAGCSQGQTCTRVTGTTGAILGYCL